MTVSIHLKNDRFKHEDKESALQLKWSQTKDGIKSCG